MGQPGRDLSRGDADIDGDFLDRSEAVLRHALVGETAPYMSRCLTGRTLLAPESAVRACRGPAGVRASEPSPPTVKESLSGIPILG